MPSEMGMKGLKAGVITQKQYDKLPPHLLDAIVKKKMKDMPKKSAPKKPKRKKGRKKK